MGLFNRNKVKNTSEQPVNSEAKKWDFSDVKFQGGVNLQGNRNNADIQKNSNQNYGNKEKAATEQRFDRVIDRNTGNAVSITHEQSQENKIINLFQASLESADIPLSQDKQKFYNRLNSGDFSEADEENFIQNNLVGPTEMLVDGEKYFNMEATGHVFENIINNPQLSKIFREAVNNYDQNYQSQLTGLLSQYPTPKQFDKIGKEIAIHAYERDKSTFAPTKQALETFKHLIYGKQYEYQKAFDALREKAQNFAANQAKNQDIHSGTFNIPNYAEPKY